MTKISEQRAYPQLCSKPLEEMELLELYAERACHRWHYSRMDSSIYGLLKKKTYFEMHQPIYTTEEINRQYEDGEITEGQYRTAFATRKRRINARMRNADYIEYAKILKYNEDAFVAYIDELIAKKLSAQPIPKSGRRRYDPRKNESINNQRRWSTRIDRSELPKLRAVRKRWTNLRSKETTDDILRGKRHAVIEWDNEKLRQIAKDRGYYTDMAVSAAVADALNMTIYAATRLINNGKFSWSQCIIVGALFEMTPKEFCDVFLNGYFREVADGNYRAYVENADELLDERYQRKGEEVDNGKTNGESV